MVPHRSSVLTHPISKTIEFRGLHNIFRHTHICSIVFPYFPYFSHIFHIFPIKCSICFHIFPQKNTTSSTFQPAPPVASTTRSTMHSPTRRAQPRPDLGSPWSTIWGTPRLPPAMASDDDFWGVKLEKMAIWLVVSTPLKNMNVNDKDYPIYYGK